GRQGVEHRTHPQPHEVGQGEGEDLGALGGGHVGRRQLLLVDLDGGEAAQQVPVERASSGGRHVGHQRHALVGDLADTGDELEGRPVVLAGGGGQGDQLVGGGGQGRDVVAVAVPVRLAPRGRE